MAEEQLASVTWEGYEHNHGEKSADWYWILGIGTLTITVAAIVLGNVLFGVLVLVAGIVVAITSARPAQIVSYAVTTRGIRVDQLLYPYSTLEAFFIDEENPQGPQLLVRSERLLMPLLVIPLPEEYVDDIEEMLASRLPEEHLEEPLVSKLIETLGF